MSFFLTDLKYKACSVAWATKEPAIFIMRLKQSGSRYVNLLFPIFSKFWVPLWPIPILLHCGQVGQIFGGVFCEIYPFPICVSSSIIYIIIEYYVHLWSINFDSWNFYPACTHRSKVISLSVCRRWVWVWSENRIFRDLHVRASREWQKKLSKSVTYHDQRVWQIVTLYTMPICYTYSPTEATHISKSSINS